MPRLHHCCLVAVALFLGGSTPVFAQDQLGVFFDEQGASSAATTSGPYGQVSAWIQLLNPSTTESITGCEFRLEIQTDGPDPILVWTLPGQALNVLEAPSFLMGYGSPLAPAERVTLARVLIILPEAGQTAWLNVHPVAQPSLLDPPGFGYPVCYPAYIQGNDHSCIAMTPVSGCASTPVATINADDQPPRVVMDQLPDQITIGTWYNGDPLQPLVIHNNGPVSYRGQVRTTGGTPALVSVNGGYLTDQSVPLQVPVGGYARIVAAYPEGAFTDSSLELEVCGQVWSVPFAAPCTWSPAAIDFDQLPTGSQSQQSVRLTNTGPEFFHPLEVIDAGPFHLVGGYNCDTLQPGESCNYTVYFRPLQAGEFVENVVQSASHCTLELRGQAIDIPPSCAPSTTEVVFPDLVVDTPPLLVRVGVTNAGGGVLAGEATLTDPAGVFRFPGGESAVPYSLAYHQTTYFQVLFSAEAEGHYQGELVLGEGCGRVSLSGTALELGPQCQVGSPYASDDGVVTVPPQQVGETGYAYLTVANGGGGLLEVSPSLADTTEGFRLFRDGGASLSYQQSMYLYVLYQPRAVGADTTFLDLGAGCDPVMVVGQGEEPYASCYTYPFRLDAGRVPVGQSTASYFYVYNSGYLDLQGHVGLVGEGFQLATPGPFDLPIGSSRFDLLLFSPPGVGSYQATVTTGLDPCPGNWTFSGRGVPPGSDRIGFYVDQGGTDNHFDPDGSGQTATVYLVLHQPSAEGPLTQWYANFACSGGLTLLDDWEASVPGSLAGFLYAKRFTPQVPMPLAEDMLLASFTVRAADALEPALLRFGYAYYRFEASGTSELVPLYSPENLLVNGAKSLVEDLPAAPVVEPVAAEGAEFVRVRWPAGLMDLEGFHVYRRLLDGPPEKLTTEPVMATDGEAVYQDTTLPAGSVEAVYFVTALHLGQESLPGQETVLKIVALEVPGPPPTASTRLRANYPNPFNPETRLPFELAVAGKVQITIFDLAGRLVRTLVDEEFVAGGHEVVWNGRDDAGRVLPSNVYYAKLEADGAIQLQKMTLLK